MKNTLTIKREGIGEEIVGLLDVWPGCGQSTTIYLFHHKRAWKTKLHGLYHSGMIGYWQIRLHRGYAEIPDIGMILTISTVPMQMKEAVV